MIVRDSIPGRANIFLFTTASKTTTYPFPFQWLTGAHSWGIKLHRLEPGHLQFTAVLPTVYMQAVELNSGQEQ